LKAFANTASAAVPKLIKEYEAVVKPQTIKSRTVRTVTTKWTLSQVLLNPEPLLMLLLPEEWTIFGVTLLN